MGELWKRFSGKRQRLLKKLIRRDNGQCRFCLRPVKRYTRMGAEKIPDDQATIEHWPEPRRTLPYERWYDLECVLLACYRCNQDQDGTMVPADQLAPHDAVPTGWTMAAAFARAGGATA
jgi:5-methylcytosine-specific restriction endonuclease McrA